MMKRIIIEGQLYEVVELQKYINNTDIYPRKTTAIDCGEYVYPITDDTDRPGILINQHAAFSSIIEPKKEEDLNNYSSEHIIDFSDIKNISEYIDKQQCIRELEANMLSSVDSVFIPKRTSEDHPIMTGLKDAVDAKQIDLDKYESRFGSNFNNDRRLFNKSKISLQMLERIADALDIDIEMTLKDKPNAPNPMGREVFIKINTEDNNNEN